MDPSHCCTLFYGVKRAGISPSRGQKLLPLPATTTSPGLDPPCPGLHCSCAPQGSPGITAIHQSSLCCSFSWPEWSRWDPESPTLAPPWALRHPAMLHLLASPPKPVCPCWQPRSPWEVHGALSNLLFVQERLKWLAQSYQLWHFNYRMLYESYNACLFTQNFSDNDSKEMKASKTTS